VISPEQRRAVSQVSPGWTQRPQLALQQTSPTLQVFGPQSVLEGTTGMPQLNCEHRSPGSAQMPQLGLQQTLPAAHVVAPQETLAGAAEAGGAADADTAGAAAALALAGALTAGGALKSTVGSTCRTMGCGRRAARSGCSSSSTGRAASGALATTMDGAAVGFAAGVGLVAMRNGKGTVLRGGSGSATS
jgi:hypothetical protein